uniref:Large ribosomal subunit protein uL24c n=1 Tax=Porolithon onkodes TaxID=231751 RepID=A0A2Z2KS54_9FLOR|nr:50S ribosomal protein L24 [Porolithon onkodes]ASB29708.1 50S ribosomal protein L24 [Porolithon onkodes]
MKKQHKIHVKNGDTVKIISGKYKGQVGEITKILHKKKLVILKNLNLKTKHVRPKQREESGKIINIEAPIHSSNVMLYSSQSKVCSRYSIVYDENLKKYRKLKKTQELIK